MASEYPYNPPRGSRPGPPPESYPPRQYGYPPWRHYPTLDLVTFILRMVGVLIIFVGVIGIGNWITDLGGQSIWSSPGDMFEDLGSSVILIGSGGIIIAVSYMILGIARFFKGKYETR